MEDTKHFDQGYKDSMNKILEEAWGHFIEQFTSREIMDSERSLSESMFQFCFANEILSVGRNHLGQGFNINLETEWGNLHTKTNRGKNIDITCHIIKDDKEEYLCAIELKFKRKRDAKGTFGKDRLFHMYRDIGYLEKEITPSEAGDDKPTYSAGRFYFVTNNESYIEKYSKDAVRIDCKKSDIGLNDGFSIKQGKYCLNSEKEEYVEIADEYNICWEHRDVSRKKDGPDASKWHFLEIKILPRRK